MKRLLLVPLVCTLVVAFGMTLDQPALFYRTVLVIACLGTAVASLVTSTRFAPGERLHLTWIAFGVAYALAALRHSFRVWALAGGGDLAPKAVLDTLLIVQNLLVPLSLWMFVRTWRKTGLAVPASRGTQVLWITLGIAVALVAGGFPLLRGLAVAGTDLVLLVSTAGDVIGIALIVPLLMPALALRGGLLMHTWAYLAASEIAWLFYDVWFASEPTMSLQPGVEKGVEEIFRILAVSFGLIAAIAQRLAVEVRPAARERRPGDGTAAPARTVSPA